MFRNSHRNNNIHNTKLLLMRLWAATLATVDQAPIYMFIMQAIALSPDKQSESKVP